MAVFPGMSEGLLILSRQIGSSQGEVGEGRTNS